MSTWSERDVPCPACNKPVRARIARGVHINRVPQVRQQVLDRTFHRFTCTCGETFTVDVPFEYTDIERKQLLIVGTESQRPDWRSMETELATMIRRVTDLGSPLVHAIVEGLRGRVVFGIEELREKLVLWQHGFNDALIECVKLRAWTADLELAAPGSNLVVDRVAEDDGLVCTWFPREGKPREVTVSASWVRDAERDRDTLRARFPELFSGGFVSIAKLRA